MLQIRVPSDIKEIRRLQSQKKTSLDSGSETLPSHLTIEEVLDKEDAAVDGKAKAATTKAKNFKKKRSNSLEVVASGLGCVAMGK